MEFKQHLLDGPDGYHERMKVLLSKLLPAEADLTVRANNPTLPQRARHCCVKCIEGTASAYDHVVYSIDALCGCDGCCAGKLDILTCAKACSLI